MYVAKGKFCYIEELTTENIKDLFDLMQKYKDEFRKYISDQEIPDSYDKFVEWLRNFFAYDRAYQFLVYRDETKKGCIGTFYFYEWDKEKNFTKISAYFIPDVRKGLIVTETLGFAAEFSFSIMKVQELRFDVYKENITMKKIAEKLGATFLEETKSKINPERYILSYVIPKEKFEELIIKFREFENKEIKPR